MSRNGWGLVGICGAILMSLLLPAVEQHPLLWWSIVVVCSIGLVTGIGLLLSSSILWMQNHHSAAFLTPGWLNVPLHTAARLGYEAEEKAGLGGVTGTHYSSPDVGLDHYKHVFLSARAVMYGARPPSTVRRLIPLDEYDELSPVAGESALMAIDDLGRGRAPRYVNVTLRRRDMKREIKEYLDILRRNPKH